MLLVVLLSIRFSNACPKDQYSIGLPLKVGTSDSGKVRASVLCCCCWMSSWIRWFCWYCASSMVQASPSVAVRSRRTSLTSFISPVLRASSDFKRGLRSISPSWKGTQLLVLESELLSLRVLLLVPLGHAEVEILVELKVAHSEVLAAVLRWILEEVGVPQIYLPVWKARQNFRHKTLQLRRKRVLLLVPLRFLFVARELSL